LFANRRRPVFVRAKWEYFPRWIGDLEPNALAKADFFRQGL
jgi:hypothetical protein